MCHEVTSLSVLDSPPESELESASESDPELDSAALLRTAGSGCGVSTLGGIGVGGSCNTTSFSMYRPSDIIHTVKPTTSKIKLYVILQLTLSILLTNVKWWLP